MVFKQTRERSSAHSRSCYTGACILGPAPSPQNMASPTSCCQLSFLKAYRTGTELAPYWHPYCVNPACIATTMLTLAQICDNDSLPVSSDFSYTPLVFHFSSHQSGSLQWPSLATEMKTSWCCICKFLRWTVSYPQFSSPWAFSHLPLMTTKTCLSGLKTSQLLFEPTPDNSSPLLSQNVRNTVYPDDLSKFFTLLKKKWILHSYHQQNGPRKATPPRNIQKSSITITPSWPLLTITADSSELHWKSLLRSKLNPPIPPR